MVKNSKKPTQKSNSRSKATAYAKKKAKVLSKKQIKNIAIAAISIVVIIAIALAAFYFIAPEKFKSVLDGILKPPLPPTTLEGDTLEVRYLDIGQGDCVIIRLPDGKNMIIDAGGTKSKGEVEAEKVILDTIAELNITTFDYMMASHTDADHVDFLDSVLGITQVNKVFRPAFLSESEAPRDGLAKVDTRTYNNFIEAVKGEPNCAVEYNVDDKVIEGAGYKISIFALPMEHYRTSKVGASVDAYEKNRVSPLVLIEYGGRTMVFTGDLEGNGGNNGEKLLIDKYQLAARKLNCDVLKVGHHGSASSASEDFLDIIDVEYAIISVGVDNSHGHPHENMLSRLNNYRDKTPHGDAIGIQKIYRTDKDGGVILQVGANGGMKWETTANAA